MDNIKKLKFFEFACRDDTGAGNSLRTDCSTFQETLNGQVFVVCDGSPHEGFVKVSQIAVNSIIKFFNHKFYSNPVVAVKNSILFASRQVYFSAHINYLLQEKGTTCSILLVRDNLVYYAQVGGSTIFLYRNGELKRLDQKKVLIGDDEIPGMDQDAENPNRKKSPGKSLGRNNLLEVRVTDMAFTPQNDDLLMLCTDGLTDTLNDNQISNILKQDITVENTVATLLDKTRYEGCEDNVTIQLLQFCNITRTEKVKSKKPFIELFPEKLISFLTSKWTMLALLVLIVGGILMLVLAENYVNRFRAHLYKVIQEEENKISEMAYEDFTEIEKWGEKEAKNLLEDDAEMLAELGGGERLYSVQEPVALDQNTILSDNLIVLKGLSGDTVYIMYTIAKKETLFGISKKFNQRTDQVMKVNRMKKPDIFVGSKLKIGIRGVHPFVEGENIEDIAKKYMVDIVILISANSGKVKYKEPDLLLIPFANK